MIPLNGIKSLTVSLCKRAELAPLFCKEGLGEIKFISINLIVKITKTLIFWRFLLAGL
jgi:hypothetical protein